MVHEGLLHGTEMKTSILDYAWFLVRFCNQFRRRVGLIPVSFCLCVTAPHHNSRTDFLTERGRWVKNNRAIHACLSQLLSYTLYVHCCDLWQQYRSTAASEERHKDAHKWSCLKATMVFGAGNVRWINRFLENNGLFTSAILQKKKAISFPPEWMYLFTILHVIISQILYQCFELYWLLCI